MKRLFPLVFAFAIGCTGTETETPPPEPPPVEEPEVELSKGEQAAAIAKEIKASPGKAEDILKGHGMTREQFETMLFEVAQDAKESEAYAAALGS